MSSSSAVPDLMERFQVLPVDMINASQDVSPLSPDYFGDNSSPSSSDDEDAKQIVQAPPLSSETKISTLGIVTDTQYNLVVGSLPTSSLRGLSSPPSSPSSSSSSSPRTDEEDQKAAVSSLTRVPSILKMDSEPASPSPGPKKSVRFIGIDENSLSSKSSRYRRRRRSRHFDFETLRGPFTLALVICWSFAVAEFFVLIFNWSKPCDRPLPHYVLGSCIGSVLFAVLFSFPQNLYLLWRNMSSCLRIGIGSGLLVVLHGWCIAGSTLLFSSSSCVQTNPHVFNMSLTITLFFLLLVALEVLVIANVWSSRSRSKRSA